MKTEKRRSREKEKLGGPDKRVRRKSQESRISLTKFLCTSRSLRSALADGQRIRKRNKINRKAS